MMIVYLAIGCPVYSYQVFLCTSEPRFRQLSRHRCNLPTRDRRYLAVRHTTSGRRWPGVSPSIIRYSFTDLGRMEGWVGLAALEGREICWYNIYGEWNPGRSHGSTVVYQLCYSFRFSLQQLLQIFGSLYAILRELADFWTV